MKESKVFVGTLYSGENEFDECVDSIKKQSYSNFDHFIYKNLPKREAHATLYNAFTENNNKYDLLIKIDADMVLTSDMLFEKIVQKFFQNDWMDVLSIAIYDFFSNQLINGLNTYRNHIRWFFNKTSLNADISDVSTDRYFYDKRELAPAAIHCKNPSMYQAFHYGVHRGLKAMQPKGGSLHWASMERTWKNFQQLKDVRIGLASLGAELAYSGEFGIEDLDYTNLRMKDILEKYLPLDVVRVEREVRKSRLLNWGFLPNTIRRKILISRISLK